MNILITGSAGFIGFSFSSYICKKYKNIKIIGIDNLNSYYSINYKKKRINELKKNKNFEFKKVDLVQSSKIDNLFKKYKFKYVFNFAAQAGVRYSIKKPKNYFNSNMIGYFNLLESIKKYKIKRLFYASSSSVYGEKKKFPTDEKEKLNPNNFYSLSKTFNEEVTNIYTKLYFVKATGLRFFTVYGEWGRPDMFLFKLFNSITQNKKFYLNNSGNHERDFTYINDVNYILEKLLNKKNQKNHEIFNICAGNTVNLKTIIKKLKKIEKIKIRNLPLHRADLLKTHGSNKKLLKSIGKFKFTNIDKVLIKILNWYKNNNINKYLKI